MLLTLKSMSVTYSVYHTFIYLWQPVTAPSPVFFFLNSFTHFKPVTTCFSAPSLNAPWQHTCCRHTASN